MRLFIDVCPSVFFFSSSAKKFPPVLTLVPLSLYDLDLRQSFL